MWSRNRYFLFLSVIFFSIYISQLSAQEGGGYYGFQVSPGFSTQKWNTQSRGALLTINADGFMSMYGENPNNIYYAKLGYHQRGSSINYSNYSQGFNSSLKYVFHNAVVGAGVQKMLEEKFGFPFYYLLGVRVEYTITTNLKSFDRSQSLLFHPHNNFVNRINYGFDFGGGFLYKFDTGYDVFLELIVSPDYSLQYEQEPIFNVRNPYHPSQTINLPKRYVRNLSFELSIGLRLEQ